MAKKLAPKPHLITSIRARNWSVGGALMEWVDNSLQHGKASRVAMLIDNAGAVGISDNGIGIDDINRIFTLADSSSYGDLGNIGQFGVGATDAMVWLGQRCFVDTVRDGRFHTMSVDWEEVRKTDWPDQYNRKGRIAKTDEIGTKIRVTHVFKQYQKLTTSYTIAEQLGLVFAPALRAGANLRLTHFIGKEVHNIPIVEFNPADLTDETLISGAVKMPDGTLLNWKGTAGLSASLHEQHNGVHIAFGHRVIEKTTDPFMGIVAPSLYVNVQLDATTPWKYQLSDHKDRVVHYREELVHDIFLAIKPLLEKARRAARSFALEEFKAFIEGPINQAIKDAAGDVFVDPADVKKPGPRPPGPGPRPDDPKPRTPKVRPPRENGETATEAPGKQAGFQVAYVPGESLDGGAWALDVGNNQITLKLHEKLFANALGAKQMKSAHVMQVVVALLSSALAERFRTRPHELRDSLPEGLLEKLENWSQNPHGIASYFYGDVIDKVKVV